MATMVSRSSIPAPPDSDRRSNERFAVEWAVDCVGDETFLYAEVTNISQMGIFVACDEPFEVGTLLTLKFKPRDSDLEFSLPGRVQWVNRSNAFAQSRNPGMGIRFVELCGEDRERIVEAIHTIAYVREFSN
jgi:type IV pilus assembly protein PilZ